jgi:hypothetical protein
VKVSSTGTKKPGVECSLLKKVVRQEKELTIKPNTTRQLFELQEKNQTMLFL